MPISSVFSFISKLPPRSSCPVSKRSLPFAGNVENRDEPLAADCLDEDRRLPHGSQPEEIGIAQSPSLFRLSANDGIADAPVDRCSPLYLVRSQFPQVQGQRDGPAQRHDGQLDDGQSAQRRHRAPELHVRPHRRPHDLLLCFSHVQLDGTVGLAAADRGQSQIQFHILSQVPKVCRHRIRHFIRRNYL